MAIVPIPTNITPATPVTPPSEVAIATPAKETEVLTPTKLSVFLLSALGRDLPYLTAVGYAAQRAGCSTAESTAIGALHTYWTADRINTRIKRWGELFGVVGMHRAGVEGEVVDCLCFSTRPDYWHFNETKVHEMLKWMAENQSAVVGLQVVKASEVDNAKSSRALLDGTPLLVRDVKYSVACGALSPEEKTADVIMVPVPAIGECGEDFAMAQLSHILAQTMDFAISQDKNV